eukprot:6256074-Pyramimonas_sp.AAC.1
MLSLPLLLRLAHHVDARVVVGKFDGLRWPPGAAAVLGGGAVHMPRIAAQHHVHLPRKRLPKGRLDDARSRGHF